MWRLKATQNLNDNKTAFDLIKVKFHSSLNSAKLITQTKERGSISLSRWWKWHPDFWRVIYIPAAEALQLLRNGNGPFSVEHVLRHGKWVSLGVGTHYSHVPRRVATVVAQTKRTCIVMRNWHNKQIYLNALCNFMARPVSSIQHVSYAFSSEWLGIIVVAHVIPNVTLFLAPEELDVVSWNNFFRISPNGFNVSLKTKQKLSYKKSLFATRKKQEGSLVIARRFPLIGLEKQTSARINPSYLDFGIWQ